MTLSPGATGQFQGTCTNTGSVTWVRGSQTQAFLATCCPEGSTVTFSTWGVTGGRYGTQSTDAVAPGQMGLFVFNLTVPLGMASGTYYSYGVVVNANNQLVSENAVIFVVVVP